MEIQFIDITSYRGISSDAEHYYAKLGEISYMQENLLVQASCEANTGISFVNGEELRYFPSPEEARAMWEKDHGRDKRELVQKWKEDDILDLQESGTIRFPSILSIVKRAREMFPSAVLCFSMCGSRKAFATYMMKLPEEKAIEIIKIVDIFDK